MKVLLVHMRYEPDATGTAPLVSQLAQDLVQSGADVVVIASLPHYGRKSVHPDYQNRRGFFHRSREKGVEIIRTPIFIPRNPGIIQRALNYLSYNLNSIAAGVMVREIDVVLAINPPITTTFSAWLLSVFHRTPLVVGIQDIWPDCIIQIGQLQNWFVIATSKILERVQYAVAKKVVVLSQGMKENLLAKGVREEKVKVIPNWADPDEVIPLPKENSFFKEQGLMDHFVVLFAGNHGYNAALEYIIQAAELLIDYPDILLLFVGEGSVKEDLLTLAENKKLRNTRFLSTLEKSQWLEMLAAADLGLISLRKELADLNVPSKVYTLMAASRPILASVPERSEIAHLIQQAQCGYITPPEDPAALVEKILDCRRERDNLDKLGKNGRDYLLKYLNREIRTDQYYNLLKTTITEENR